MKKLFLLLLVGLFASVGFAQTDSLDIVPVVVLVPPKPADTLTSMETFRYDAMVRRNKTQKIVLRGTSMGADSVIIRTFKADTARINGRKVITDSMTVHIKAEVVKVWLRIVN